MKSGGILSISPVQGFSPRNGEEHRGVSENHIPIRRMIMNGKKTAIAFFVLTAICFVFYLYGREFGKSAADCSFEGGRNEPAYHYEALYTVRKANDFSYY